MRIRLSTLDILVIAAVIASGVVGMLLMYWLLGGTSIVITNNPPDAASGPVAALTGLPCPRHASRPVAVMLASDPEARPLSGISQADMVFEMPVTPNGITRMMAVFQCHEPEEIGSIRSARSDFIPLAQGIDAILVHWGGEKAALEALDGGIMDNVDALKYEGTTFYRKKGAPAPHNGFTTLDLVGERSARLGYRATTSLDPYVRTGTRTEQRNLGSLVGEVSMPWLQDMDVRFVYDAATGTYLRSRGGEPEMDEANGRQAYANVVVVMETRSHDPDDQYMRVDTVGNGVATIWQDGGRISALWKKERATDMLQFTDRSGAPIPLGRGIIWILIDAPLLSL
jgi:hypothetical protein